MRKKTMVVSATLAVAAGTILFSMREPLLLAMGDYLVVQDNLQQADLIAVISGPDDRTDYGIELYKRGYGGRLFFSGGWCDVIQETHAERGQARAVAQGVPASEVVIDNAEVTSTYAEAVRLKAYMDGLSSAVKSVIVVSDPYHMRRARWAYRRVLGDEIEVQMAPVPFESSSYQRRWWSDPGTSRYVKDEYLKLAYYLVRYQFSSGKVQQWLASLDGD